MRLLVRLNARMNAVYDTSYHAKLRGRVWNALKNTPYDKYHDEGTPSLPLCYSNPFPPGEISEGDTRHLLFSSPEPDLLTELALDFHENPEVNIGEMPFQMEEVSLTSIDAGEPGTTGTIMTDTGVVCTLSPEELAEYGIETEHTQDSFWQPEYSVEPFFDKIRTNLSWKADRFLPDYVPGPEDVEYDLFDGFEMLKTYSVPVEVSQDVELTFVLSKWNLEYTVQDDTHRKLLNLLYETGIGERNTLGFGFVNPSNPDREVSQTSMEATL